MRYQCSSVSAGMAMYILSLRELRGLETRGAEIEKHSLQILDTAHLQCRNKLELSETRTEKLCQETFLQTICLLLIMSHLPVNQ